MELLTPDPGLAIWTLISFLLLVFLLGKYAWKPILNAIHVREETIEYSLREAEKARIEIVNVHNNKRQILDQARKERDTIIREGRDIKDSMIGDAKNLAQKEADKIVSQAKAQIEADKQAALEDMKKQVALLSIDLTSKILEHELDTPLKHKEVIDRFLENANFN